MPSIEAMLITLAGRAGEAALRNAGAIACVRKKGVLVFRSSTLSQPSSGNSSKAAPHAAPALLTRISTFGSCAITAAASPLAPATVDTFMGMEMQVAPSFDNSLAVSLHASALRAEM